MKMSFPNAFREGWALFKRDREVLIAVAAPFLFLPTLALLLLVPAAPIAPARGASDAELEQFAQSLVQWLSENGYWFAAASILSLFGGLTITAFYLDLEARDVRDAAMRALRLLPRYLLAALLILVPASFGLLAFALPGLYVLGRTMLVSPAMIAEPPLPAVRAIARSIALTRGNGLQLAALAGLGLLAGQILPAPFQAIDEAMRAAGADNPIAIVMLDAVAAAIAASIALATILLRVTIYRQLAPHARR